jgi:hypothetical protein
VEGNRDEFNQEDDQTALLICSVCQHVKSDRFSGAEPEAVATCGKAWSIIGVDTLKVFGGVHCLLIVTSFTACTNQFASFVHFRGASTGACLG